MFKARVVIWGLWQCHLLEYLFKNSLYVSYFVKTSDMGRGQVPGRLLEPDTGLPWSSEVRSWEAGVAQQCQPQVQREAPGLASLHPVEVDTQDAGLLV